MDTRCLQQQTSSVGLLPTKTPRWSSGRLYEAHPGSLANITRCSSSSISLLGGRLPCQTRAARGRPRLLTPPSLDRVRSFGAPPHRGARKLLGFALCWDAAFSPSFFPLAPSQASPARSKCGRRCIPVA